MMQDELQKLQNGITEASAFIKPLKTEVGRILAGQEKLLNSMILALIASVGTPAAPGAGAVVLFTILSGMGFTNEAVMMGYTIILAINRPIEMLVTSLNCVGDSVAAIAVAKTEGKLDETAFDA